MNAEEPGFWLDEIELDVPTVPPQHMGTAFFHFENVVHGIADTVRKSSYITTVWSSPSLEPFLLRCSEIALVV